MALLSSLALSLSSCVSCALSEGFVKRVSCFTDEPLEHPKYTNQNFVPFYVLVITLSEQPLLSNKPSQRRRPDNFRSQQNGDLISFAFSIIAVVITFIGLLFLLIEKLARGPHKELAKKVGDIEKTLCDLQSELARDHERDKLFKEVLQILRQDDKRSPESRVFKDDTLLLPYN